MIDWKTCYGVLSSIVIRRPKCRVVGIFSCILFLWPCLSITLMGKAIENAGVLVIEAEPVTGVGSHEISVAYHRTKSGEDSIEVSGLPDSTFATVFDSIKVYTVDPDINKLPAILGSWIVEEKNLLFQPRFSLQAGLNYFIQIKLEQEKSFSFTFSLPQKDLSPVTSVAAVYPTRSELPENLLKFYIHFSQPMSMGNVYDYIHLFHEDGNELDLPFLELGEELWDYDTQRLTLLFDPGRIKTGLVPNLEEGMVLQRGKNYTLKIDSDWQDAEGRPLVSGFEKNFSVGPADTTSPNPYNWKKHWPKADTRETLSIVFPESLDEALLQRLLLVLDESGEVVQGSVSVSDHETRWEFTPETKWRAGKHRVEIETILEDLAGNNIARPFELDKKRSESYRTGPKRVYLDFETK